jgi:hypothetical protein
MMAKITVVIIGTPAGVRGVSINAQEIAAADTIN